MPERGAMQVLPDSQAVARALAESFAAAAGSSVARRGAFNVALSGGTTPRAAYELLAAEPLRSQVDWRRAFVYFGDERCVPPDDAASNYRMAREAFLDAVPIPDENVFRMKGEIDPGIAANEYASSLRAELGALPSFDLILLGLGEDGHTASLFPGAHLALDEDSLVAAVAAPAHVPGAWRITITPGVINAADRVVFAVAGAEKAAILATVYEGDGDPARYPAQLVKPASGDLTWLVDSAAASALRGRPA